MGDVRLGEFGHGLTMSEIKVSMNNLLGESRISES